MSNLLLPGNMLVNPSTLHSTLQPNGQYRVNRQHPQLRKCIAMYPLLEGAGNVAYDHFGGYDGSIDAGTWAMRGGRKGMEFNTNGDMVDVGDLGTIEGAGFWFYNYTEIDASSTFTIPISFEGSPDFFYLGTGTITGFLTNEILSVIARDGSNDTRTGYSNASDSIIPGWHYIEMSRGGSNYYYIWLDGVRVDNAKSGVTPSQHTAAEFTIGDRGAKTSPVNGIICDVRVYDQVRSTIENKETYLHWHEVYKSLEQSLFSISAFAAPSGETVNLSAGSLALSGQSLSAVATEHNNIAVGAGTLTLTGQSLSAVTTAGDIVEIAAGSLAVTGQILSAVTTEGDVVELAAGSLAVAGQALSAVTTEADVVELAAGSLAVTGQSLSAVVTAGETSQVPAGSLAVSGQSLSSVTTEHHLSDLAAGTLTISGQSLTVIATAVNVSEVSAGNLSLTGQSISVVTASGEIVQIASGSLTIAGQSLSAITTDHNITSLDAALLALSGGTITVEAFSCEQVVDPESSAVTIIITSPGSGAVTVTISDPESDPISLC